VLNRNVIRSLVLVFFASVASVGVAAVGRSVAWAADPAKAEALIQQANELRRQGRDQRALPLLQQAYELARTPRTAAQLGLAELALGYWVEAEDHLSQALNPVAHHPWVDKNRAVLEGSLKSARSHLAELTIDGRPDGAEVRLNGKAIGTTPLPGAVKVSEGRAEIELRRAGHATATRTLTVAGGSAERVSIELVPVAVTPPVAVAANPAPVPVPASPAIDLRRPARAAELPRWRRVLPWSLAGGAALGLAVGIWQHAAWRGKQGDFEAIGACGANAPMRGADPRCGGLYDDLSGDRTRAFVAYGVAGALGAGAAVLLLMNSRSGGDAETGYHISLARGEAGLSYALRFR
jgi:hypothetical protein